MTLTELQWKAELEAHREKDAKIAALQSQLTELRAACEWALASVDEAFKATGYIKIAKSSVQRVLIEAAIGRFRCPLCDCHSFARIDELKPDGRFAPGLDIRCVGCKKDFLLTAAGLK